MRKLAHALIVLLAVLPWLIGCVGFGLALLLGLAADRLNPDARRGNCWTFAGPKWAKAGGYLAVRMAGFPRICGRRFVPHAIWVPSLAGVPLEQTEPDHRITSLWGIWQVPYFDFHIRTTE